MRGLDLRLPQIARDRLTPADFVTWEVLYDDGTTQREDLGVRYGEIDRGRLRSFRLHRGGETLIETFPPLGATGRNLVYRRRTTMNHGGDRRVIFLVSWYPMGPALALDPAAESYRTAPGFVPGDPDFDPPVLHPWEGEPTGPPPLTRA